MTTEDVPAVAALAHTTFRDLDARIGLPVDDAPVSEALYPRYRGLVESDPGGAWVDERDGELLGAALALVREGLWGLSLLVVHPAHQSTGIGRSLLANTLAYGSDAAAGIILSSEDPRALRAYFSAGFDLRPAMDAAGPVRRRPAPEPAVRPIRWPADRELVDAVGRHVRGAGHGQDVPAWLAMGCDVDVHEAGGFSVRFAGKVILVAALEDATAAALLRAGLRATPEGEDADVMFLTAGQDWAFRTVLDAGLRLRPAGAVMTRGEIAGLRPYLPSGAYL